MTTTDAPPDLDPMRPPHRDDPHSFHQEARACPVAHSPSLGAFLVSRYDDLVTVLDDPETFSSANALPSLGANPPEVVAELSRVPQPTLLHQPVSEGDDDAARRLREPARPAGRRSAGTLDGDLRAR